MLYEVITIRFLVANRFHVLVSLDRPPLNALTLEAIVELTTAFEQADVESYNFV